VVAGVSFIYAPSLLLHELNISFTRLGPSYTSYFQYSHLPYCSFEWGNNGYAGCSNHGGELLYLSRPSKKTGLIMVRGHFATSLYASLSRSQIDFGGPSTFGLEVTRCPYAYDEAGEYITQDEILKETESAKKKAAKNGSSFELGGMIDRGCFNYRWASHRVLSRPASRSRRDRNGKEEETRG
jgi:hypothetical protein